MWLAPYHPQVVHFVVALLIVGVVFRLVSLTRRFTYTGPAATTLILLGTLALVRGREVGRGRARSRRARAGRPNAEG